MDASRVDRGDAKSPVTGRCSEVVSSKPTCGAAKRFSPVLHPIAELNALEGGDSDLTFTPGELKAFFTSQRNGKPWSLYEAVRARADLKFQPPRIIHDPGDAGAEETAPWLTSDGLTMYYVRDRTIHVASRMTVEDVFGSGTAIPNIAGELGENWPRLSRNGCRLYFTASTARDEGDIYVATVTESGFIDPKPMVSLNSDHTEGAPTLSEDELVIYFATARATGSNYRIWVASRSSVTEEFGPPTEVRELDFETNEFPNYLSSDGCTLYVSTGNSRNPYRLSWVN